MSARPGMFFTGYEPIGGYPVFVERAQGPYLWDVDGNRYVDFLLGFGSVVLGHARPEVTDAAIGALRTGVNPTLLSVVHLELAEKIVAVVPSAELVTFLRTGSDATDAAVRLARAVTDRSLVLQWGYHGWHDWSAVGAAGVIEHTRERTLPLVYNDIDHARRAMAAHAGEVAAIVVMPYEVEPPQVGYLLELQKLAHANGALFVLDEVRSGFRIALGGAQAAFGLQPDLSAFSKAMANGHAISALAGPRSVMAHILKLGLTVTFYRSPAAMAAALATIRILERERAPERLAQLGARLLRGLNQAIQAAGVEARAVGLPATPFIRFNYKCADVRDRAMRLFCTGMLRGGVLMTPAHHWFVCTSMSDDDIDRTVELASHVLGTLHTKL